MSYINVANVSKNFGKSQILKEVKLSLEKGDQCVIQGASGSGKSTLLYLLGGLERLSSGSIDVGGLKLENLDDDQLANFRNKEVGFVFQFHFLLSSLSCLENIYLPARLGGVAVSEVEPFIFDLAQKLGVEECLSMYPYQISGGQQQRINIIRALSMKPSFLLCDEPTGNLDSKNSEIVTNLLIELSKKQNTTLVVVTHNERVSAHFSDIYEMNDGVLR